jgi:mycothiol S-conjugate amidase
LQALGRIREAELRAVAQVLGIRRIEFLDYVDGDLDQADPNQAAGKIASAIRRFCPQVILTFEPFGAYGHPDHIAICQFTTAAVVQAADPAFQDGRLPPHRVSKLYYMVVSPQLYDAWLDIFGDINMPVDGVSRGAVAWADWAITTRIDGAPYWRQAWQAVCCHTSQLSSLGDFQHITDEQHSRVWGDQTFYRAFSLANGGRKIETDLFEGLR